MICDHGFYKVSSLYVENGLVLFLWIGLHASSEWLQQVFGVATIGHVDIEMVRLTTIVTLFTRNNIGGSD
jgi:hypothetical protein